MANPVPVLNLSTKTDRQQVRIDGKLYDLRSADELSFLDYQAQAKKFHALGQLLAKRKPTAADLTSRAKLLNELCRLVLDAPADVHKKLRDGHRMDIITVFSQLLSATMTTRAGAKSARADVKHSKS